MFPEPGLVLGNVVHEFTKLLPILEPDLGLRLYHGWNGVIITALLLQDGILDLLVELRVRVGLRHGFEFIQELTGCHTFVKAHGRSR